MTIKPIGDSKIAEGNSVQLTATEVLSVNALHVVEDLVGVVRHRLQESVQVGENYTLELSGVFAVKCKTGETIKLGEKVYYDKVTKAVTKTATSNKYVGIALEAITTSKEGDYLAVKINA